MIGRGRRRLEERIAELETRVEGLETLLAGTVQISRVVGPVVGSAMAHLADEVDAERHRPNPSGRY